MQRIRINSYVALLLMTVFAAAATWLIMTTASKADDFVDGYSPAVVTNPATLKVKPQAHKPTVSTFTPIAD